MDYSGYPEYEQVFPPFDHHVSVLDLLFSCGPDSMRMMLTGKSNLRISKSAHNSYGCPSRFPL
jgi:hypothetical protein